MRHIYKYQITTLILVLVFSFSSFNKVFSQPGSNPVFTNPYQTNPFGSNPFGATQDKSDKKGKQNNDKVNNDKSVKENNQNGNILNSENQLTEKQRLELERRMMEASEEEVNNNNDYNKTKSVDTISFIKRRPSDIYGLDFFNNNNFKLQEGEDVISPPSNYELGSGDEILVSAWGQSQLQKKYTIGKDGAIYNEFLGKIYLQGLTFDNAKTLVRNKFKTIMPNSSVDVQLGKVRTIRVRITGEVNVPGVYTMSSFNSAINALSFVGGIKESGSIRNIKIIRDGQLINTIDMYRFLKDGGDDEDVFLEDNDIINVALNEKLVKAEGAFKRPMYYQLKENEHLSEFMKWTGGARYDARTSLVQIKTVMNEESKLIDVNWNKLNETDDDIKLLDGDIVIVKTVNQVATNTVEIKGAVKYPDTYELEVGDNKKTRLADLIEKSGGLTGDAYLYRAYVYRANDNLYGKAININLSELKIYDNNSNIELFPGDVVMINSNSTFRENFKITVTGEVRDPGDFPYYSNLTLKDLLINAGGIKLTAESGRIEISNIVDSANNFDIKLNKTSFKTIAINPDLSLDENSESIIIKPYDRIYVRKKSDFRLQEKIYVLGQVKYPGEYTKLDVNETISSLVKRSGGLTSQAFVDGAIIMRDSSIGHVAIDLERAIKGYRRNDLKLEEGDTLYVPSKIDIVKVIGQVQRPTNLKFEEGSNSVKNYISASGGFSERPWKDRIVVSYPNGRSKATKRIFFIRKYPKVREGSIVIVPIKPERAKFEFKDLFTGAATILTTATTGVVLYNSLK